MGADQGQWVVARQEFLRAGHDYYMHIHRRDRTGARCWDGHVGGQVMKGKDVAKKYGDKVLWCRLCWGPDVRTATGYCVK